MAPLTVALPLLFCLATATTLAAGLACPKLTPVPVDEHFLFRKQPEGGFYAPIASGEDSIPSYTAKKVPPNPAATHKACFKAKMVVGGKELFSGPPVECKYHEISHMYCEPGAGDGAVAAMGSIGVKIPKVVDNVLVDTDNKTYVAMGGCIDGSIYQWSILNVNPKNRKVHERTVKALHVTSKQIKDSAGKKFKPGRTIIQEGACGNGGGGLGGIFDG